MNLLTVKEIKNADRNYVKNKKYYVVGYQKDLKTYDTMDIYLKSGDNKYIVRSLGGNIFMDVEKCLLQKDIIVDEIKSNYKNKSDIKYGAARLWVDEIIHPDDTKITIIRTLEIINNIKNIKKPNFGVLQV